MAAKRTLEETRQAISRKPEFLEHMLEVLRQPWDGKLSYNTDVVTYYLAGPGEVIINPSLKDWKIQTDDQSKYLPMFEEMFENIRKKVGLDFKAVENREDAMVDINLLEDPESISSKQNSGYTFRLSNKSGKWKTILWSDVEVRPEGDKSEQDGVPIAPYTAHHEVGHALGFSHPYNDTQSGGGGENPDFNTSDTLMSYNFEDYTPGTYNLTEYYVADDFYEAYLEEAWSHTTPEFDPKYYKLGLKKDDISPADIVQATGKKSIIIEGDKDDEITGLSDLNDRIDTNDGDDTIYLSSGYDQIRTGTGRDTIVITKDLIDDYMGFSSLNDYNYKKDTIAFSADILEDDDLMEGISLTQLGNSAVLSYGDDLLAVFASGYEDVSSQPWMAYLNADQEFSPVALASIL